MRGVGTAATCQQFSQSGKIPGPSRTVTEDPARENPSLPLQVPPWSTHKCSSRDGMRPVTTAAVNAKTEEDAAIK